MSAVRRHPVVAFFVLTYLLTWSLVPVGSFFTPGPLLAALVEVAGGAGVAVELDGKGYPERLAAALTATLSDTERLRRLGVLATDRERAFSWRDSAERVWQLHADL